MKRVTVLIIVLVIIISLTGCSDQTEEEVDLLFYIGITMVKPVNELIEHFEQENNCNIEIIQGGSQDLYDSLKASRQGDLYLPGSYTYRENNLDDGLLLDGVLVGYNKVALVVKQGNPLGFTSELSSLSDASYRVVLGNPESGSIGKESRRILETYGNYDEAFDNAIYLTRDSKKLTAAIVNEDADICINWFATTFWEENRAHVDAIRIDEEYAEKKMLIMNLLSSSNHAGLTRKFMDYAASEEGKEIFEKYGFLDEADIKVINEVEFK